MRLFRRRSSRYKLDKLRFLSRFIRTVANDRHFRQKRPIDIAFSNNYGINNVKTSKSEGTLTVSESCSFVGNFGDLKDVLCDRLVRSLSACGYKEMTTIQKSTIPVVLDGCDVLIKSETGSGKTLAFLVPAMHRFVSPLNSVKTTRADGTKLLIIVPTRELSIQIEDTAVKIAKPFPWIVVSSINGGSSRKSEKARIRKGITILVGTPGRLLDHCETTASFNISNLETFVLDEADRLLDMGFEFKIKGIYKFISKSLSLGNSETRNIQTILTSATLSDSVKTLAKFCLHKNPKMIGIDDDILTLPNTLRHEYVITECKNKFICLISLLLKYVNSKEKIIVFVSNCSSVIYMHSLIESLRWPASTRFRDKNLGESIAYSNLPRVLERYEEKIEEFSAKCDTSKGSFNTVNKGIPIFSKVSVFMLHGNMEHNDRLGHIKDFTESKCAILISTDVASRGLNLSQVTRVIQYDPPQQLEEYIHRSGRTARIGKKGNAILILIHHEMHFVEELRKRGVCAKEIMVGLVWSYLEQKYAPKHLMNFDGDLIGFLRNSFCNFVEEDENLLLCAQKAFRAAVRAYKTYSKDLRKVFDFKKLHLGHYATSYCLSLKPSRITLAPKTNEKVKAGLEFNFGDKRPKKKPSSKAKVSHPTRKNNKTQRIRIPNVSASQAVLKALEHVKANKQLLTR